MTGNQPGEASTDSIDPEMREASKTKAAQSQEIHQLVGSETGQFTLPPDATPKEAAIIVAALGRHLEAQRAALEKANESADTWDGDRFAFAGRTERLTGVARRMPQGAPTNKWTAIGRLDRV